MDSTENCVFTYTLWAKDFDGVRKYAYRGDGKQLSPLFDSPTEAEEWRKSNPILKEKIYGN